MNFLKFNPFKSLTIGGAAGYVATMLVQSFDPSALSPKAQAALQGVSLLIGVLGLRNAQAKAAQAAIGLVDGLAAKK